MKERLVLERDIIRRLPLQYPFSHQAALAFATERIEGFSEEELENLIDENAIDWLYIEGERRIKDDFVDNLVKTRKDIRARIFDKSALAEGELEGRLRDQTIKRMKEKGGLAYYFRIRSTLKIREEAFETGKNSTCLSADSSGICTGQEFQASSHIDGASQDSAASVAAEDGMF